MRPLDRTRIEKAADCGFDLPPALRESGLLLASTRFPETVEVRVTSGTSFELSVSDASLLEALPLAQNGWKLAEGIPALYAVLERAAATARTMPDRVAAQFHLATKSMPRSTEAERMALHRSAVLRP